MTTENQLAEIDTSATPTIDLLRYYVYELRDPRDNQVFYVGKGQKNRVEQHRAVGQGVDELEGEVTQALENFEEEEDEITRHAKAERIRSIRSAGHADCSRVIVGRFETEAEAFAVEASLIKWVYGFSSLTNLVHGHRHKYVRDHSQKVSATYPHVPGIDIPRRLPGLIRLGDYTDSLRQNISENSVVEKLECLRDALCQQALLRGMAISGPDCSSPQDPCLVLSEFTPSSVRMQIKMQLKGDRVVLNLNPVGGKKSDLTTFETALTTRINNPYVVKHGGPLKLYTQTHDFKTSIGGMCRGVPHTDIRKMLQLMGETFARLTDLRGQ